MCIRDSTHYERNNDIVDLGSNQYPSVDWTRSMAANKNFPKPYYISEYAHNMICLLYTSCCRRFPFRQEPSR